MVFGVSLLAGAAVKDAAADLVDEAEKDDHEDDDEADDNFDVKDGATAEGVAAVGGAKGTASTSLPNWRGGVGGFLMLGRQWDVGHRRWGILGSGGLWVGTQPGKSIQVIRRA